MMLGNQFVASTTAPDLPGITMGMPAQGFGGRSAAKGFPFQLSPVTEQTKMAGEISRKLAADSQLADVAHLFGETSSRHYNTSKPPLDTINMSPLPEFLLRQIDNAECKCFMGLFPEINRVWLTIDNRLFLWDFVNVNEFYTAEPLQDVIISVGLVKPKPNVFEKDVKYAIVLATTHVVRMMALTTDDQNQFSLKDTAFQVNTDDIVMLAITGLENGQIFLGGRDGNMYELEYEAEESWFRRRCSLKNLTQSKLSLFIPTFLSFSGIDPIISIICDEKRKLLYSLSDNSIIQVFVLEEGTYGMVPRLLFYKRLSDEAMKLSARGHTGSLDKESLRAISLFVIPPRGKDFRDLALLAVTNRGHRIYFAVDYKMDERIPVVQQLLPVHLRMTPSIENDQDASTSSLALVQFDCAFQSNGLFFVAGSGGGISNTQFFSSIDFGSVAKKHSFYEFVSVTNSSERVWAVAEMESNWDAHAAITNDLSSQLVSFSSQYYILTNYGLYTSVRRRPIDMLVALLIQSNGHDTDSLVQFFQNYPEEQICVMLLALVCENIYVSRQLPDSPIAMVPDSQIKSWAWSLFFKFGVKTTGMPLSSPRPEQNYEIGRPLAGGDGYYSIAYNSFLSYLSRVIAPWWSTKLTEFKNDSQLVHRLVVTIKHLSNLKELVQFYMSNIHALDESERINVESLTQILDFCFQGLQFIQFMIPLKLTLLVQRLPLQHRRHAELALFSNLVTTTAGYELIREISKVAMDEIVKGNGYVENVCENLRNRCPFYFHPDDLKIFKAFELIQKARANEADPLSMLDSALKLLFEAAGGISIHQLESITGSLETLGYSEGAVALSVICGQKHDPEDFALDRYLGKAVTKPEATGIVMERNEFLGFAFKIINHTIDNLQREASVEAMEKAYKKSAVFRRVAAIQDEYFHYLFYDELLERKQLVYLLKSTDMPFLENYLSRRQNERSEYGLYLSLYYRNTRKYDLAVNKLYELANSSDFPAKLEQRIEMLSIALSILESKLVLKNAENLSGEIQDLIDVANVQWQMKSALEASDADPQVLEEFDRRLMDVNALYEAAKEFQLHESKLAVLHISGHHDEQLLVSIWKDILSADTTVEEKINKLMELGNRYRDSAFVFSLPMIVSVAESQVYGHMDAPTLWLMRTLVKIGYSYYEVFAVYDTLFEEKRPPFHQRHGLFFLLKRIVAFMNVWLDESLHNDRSSFDPKYVDERISRYQAFLSTAGEEEANVLVAKLQDLERKVRRQF